MAMQWAGEVGAGKTDTVYGESATGTPPSVTSMRYTPATVGV